jgi:hypothetical protein
LHTGKVFEIVDMEQAADSFSSCSIELNRLYHGFLSTYTPATKAKKAEPSHPANPRNAGG